MALLFNSKDAGHVGGSACISEMRHFLLNNTLNVGTFLLIAIGCKVATADDGVNIAEVLKPFVLDWDRERANHAIAAVTDNSRNIVVAVREAEQSPHIFAYTLNVSTQASLSAPCCSSFLGQVRRAAAFFY